MADEDDDSHIIASVRRILGEDASRPRPGFGGAAAPAPDVFELQPGMMIEQRVQPAGHGAAEAALHAAPSASETMPDEDELSPDLAAWASEWGEEEEEAPKPAPAPVPTPVHETHMVEPAPQHAEVETTSSQPAPVPAMPEAAAPRPRPTDFVVPPPAPASDEPILEKQNADAAGHAFGSLRETLRAQKDAVAASTFASAGLESRAHGGGATIEEMIRQELRPLLKVWLDAHLPELVERIVHAEIDRIVGRTGE